MGHTLSFSYLLDLYGEDYRSSKNGDLNTFKIEPPGVHFYYPFAYNCLSKPGYLQIISK